MCSVIGYVGKSNCRLILEGLQSLEYRGYDSAGLACFDKVMGEFQCWKIVGSVSDLQKKIAFDFVDRSPIGLGHTRWATHGIATELNAHPHHNTAKTVYAVHNGIVENYSTLKQALLAEGCVFYSDTDSEILTHLFERIYTRLNNLKDALIELVQLLEGSYACVFMTQYAPNTLLVMRKKSPLCIGVGDGEMFVASDTLAFPACVERMVALPDATVALVTAHELQLFDFNGSVVPFVTSEYTASVQQIEKGPYSHFMLKEIYEQKRVLEDTVSYMQEIRKDGKCCYGDVDSCIREATSLLFLACGTSAHAAAIATFFFKEVALLQACVVLASEFCVPRFGLPKNLLACGLSQSGETADTLEAVRTLVYHKVPVLAISNVLSSSLIRESSGYLITQAKKEIAVASTKSFTAQVGLLFLWAYQIAYQKGLISCGQLEQAEEDLLKAAHVMDAVMQQYAEDIRVKLAPLYATYKNFIFLGRHISFPFACEAALKLKEIAYIFVDVYPAGELKHGPLALVDETVPVCIFSVLDQAIYKKLVCAAQEVKARKGHLLVFAFAEQEELIALADTVFIIPRVHHLLAPLAMTGLMQLLMYHIAVCLDRPIDRPRNLAKSVTVQ